MSILPIIAVLPLSEILVNFYLQRTIPQWQTVAEIALLSIVVCTSSITYLIVVAPVISPLRNLPKAPQGPLTKRLFREPNSIDFLRWIEEVPNAGLIRYFGFLNAERVLITTTEAARTIHDGDAKVFHRPSFAKAILCRLTGGGIFAAEGAQHAAQRKELTSAFKFRHLKELYPVFWQKTTELLTALSDDLGDSSRVVDVDNWASRGTLDAIGFAAFAYDFHAVENPESDLVRKYRTAFLPGKSVARIRILAQIIPTKILFRLPVKANRDAKACIATIRTALHRVVKQRQYESDTEKSRHRDILSVILRSPQFTDPEGVVSQCMAFLAAGHEASALALGWTLFEISKHPESQQRLREEIRANVASPNTHSTINADQIDRLVFLEAVVKESLRFWGPVPRQTRVSSSTKSIAGCTIPAGTPLVISFYCMNRATANWGPDGGTWKPKRWLGSTDAKSMGGSNDRSAFSSFSHGARSCIGQRFAHSEISVFLAGLVGRFEWTFEDIPGLPLGTVEADHDSTVMLKVAGGLKLRAKVIPGW